MMRAVLRTVAVVGLGLSTIGLSACSGSNDADPPAGTASETATAAAPAPSPSPTPAASPTDTADQTAIPSPVQGRWALVDADCEEGRADAKGLLVIDADKLKFYEAVARLGKIGERTDTRVRAAFSFSGEGQTWQQDVLLDARPDGSLVRRDYGPDAMPEPLTYHRCP